MKMLRLRRRMPALLFRRCGLPIGGSIESWSSANATPNRVHELLLLVIKQVQSFGGLTSTKRFVQ